MLFDKNGEVLSYDETDIFCEELAFSDEYTAYCRYLNRLSPRGVVFPEFSRGITLSPGNQARVKKSLPGVSFLLRVTLPGEIDR